MRSNEISTKIAALAEPIPLPKTTREDVLEQCTDAQGRWAANPGRNIVLLFDGTGNILGNQRDTNIVRLMRALEKNSTSQTIAPSQIVYYDPGVGTANTFPADSVVTKFRQSIEMLAGMALGSGAFENIAEAYEFLVNHYRDGDRIFLFGFSRGAFTARAVGGMINSYGLVQPTALPMIDLMVTNYFAKTANNKRDRNKLDFSNDIVKNFALGRRPLVHFIGVFDTVETIGSGLIRGLRITNPATVDDKRYAHIRHAVSIHETRCKYRPRLYTDPKFSDADRSYRSFEERWFAGVHSDIGGSYERDGLATLSLQWIVDAAIEKGLMVTQADFVPMHSDRTLHDEAYESPYWIWTGLSSRQRGLNSVIHKTALPLDSDKQADTLPRKIPFIRYLGWVLAVAVFLLAITTSYFTSSACASSSVGSNSGMWSSFFQLLAPWHDHFQISCNETAVKKALRWDWWFIFVYFLWLPYPISWAIRRHSARGILSGHALAPWLANAQWFMVALVVADVFENTGTYWLSFSTMGAHSIATQIAAWTVSASSVIKFINIAILTFTVLSGMRAQVSKSSSAMKIT